MPPFEQLHVAGVEIARLVVGITVYGDPGVVDHDVDAPLDDERAARPDLPHELREGLLHRLVRPVDVEVVGVGRGDHRHVGIQPQERPVELVASAP